MNPPEETLPDVVQIGTGLLYSLLCVRDGTDDDRAAEVATMHEREHITSEGLLYEAAPDPDPEVVAALRLAESISTRWHVTTDAPESLREYVRRCPEYPNRRHMLVNC